MLSIIIPHYNSVDSLVRLINSVPNSKDIEVIIVDDKSDIAFDDLQKRVLDLQSNFEFTIKVFYNDGIKSAGACRNIGLREAQGDWLLFADADDYFTQDMDEILSEYLDSTEDILFFVPTSEEVGTQGFVGRHLFYEKLVCNYLDNPNSLTEAALKYRFVVPWSKMIRRDLVIKNNIQFDEVLASNDIMFATRVAQAAKSIRVLNRTIYCVTGGESTLSTNRGQAVFNARLGVFLEQYAFCKKHLTKKEFYRVHLRGMVYILRCIKFRLGFKTFIKTLYLLATNRVKLFYFSDLSVQQFVETYSKYFKEKKTII